MAALAPEHTHRLVEEILQSPPVDVNTPYDPSTLAGSTVLITGGASGIGAALARRWARLGAFVAIGDLDAVAGEALVAELRASAGSSDDDQQQQQHRHFFQRCDVTDWQSQVALFRAAARASPTGGIDAVVPAAGIAELASTASGRGFENPSPALGGDDDDDGGAPPPPPSLAVVDVNLTGVLYSVHLALYWLARNNKNNTNSDGDRDNRDRHILLIGSASGVFPLPGQPLYCAAKHALTGLFRTLRCTAWRHGDGVRVNMLCPYFIDTPLIPAGGMSLLAGAGMASLPDVVEAATRLAADRAVRGRALVVGPRIKVLDGGEAVEYVDGDGDGDEADGRRRGGYIRQNGGGGGGGGQAVWECYAHDYDSVEAFVWRYTRLLNTIERIRGWTGWVRDMVYILFYRNNPQRKGGNDAKKQR
ncbi:hypothetical protein RB600_001422 [Gaeumannomyces tritici]